MYFIVSSVILLGLIYLIEVKKSEKSYKFNNYCSFSRAIKNNFSLIKFFCISIAFVSFAMILIIKLERGGFISFNQKDFNFSFLPYIFYSSFLVPIFEEYFYRFLPYSFKKFSNIVVYVLVIFFSSLIFTYFHNVDLFESIFIFMMAILFSLIYLKTRNISYVIGCHCLYNLTTLIRIYTGYSNALIFIILLLVSIGVLFYYNERVKLLK